MLIKNKLPSKKSYGRYLHDRITIHYFQFKQETIEMSYYNFILLSMFFFFITQSSASATEDVIVHLKTNKGEIILELYPEKAPGTVENFLRYVNEKFYDGTVFHRVIDGFMIQGGGFSKAFQQKSTHASIVNEAKTALRHGLKNEVGTIAMARTSEPNSATAQFFINVADNSFLNADFPSGDGHGYAVFGKVIAGMDVVERISTVKTGPKPPAFRQDVPQDTIEIITARIQKDISDEE